MRTARTLRTLGPALLAIAAALPGLKLPAATVQTVGAGMAVTTPGRIATFDPLYTNGIPLSDYTENLLFIGVSGDSWVGDGVIDFDPFHGANGTDRRFHFPLGGSTEWVVIQTTDAKPIYALEFMYGNGWTTGDIYGQYPWGNHNAVLQWETWSGGVLVSSGVVGGAPLLEMGTIVGFYDPSGFEQLHVRSTIATSADPNLEALALDNLSVQLTNIPPAPVFAQQDMVIDPATGIPAFSVNDTIPGCQYRMVYTETLGAPAWAPVTPPLPDGWQAGGGTLSFSDPGAPGRPQRFYRVQVR